MFLVIILKSLKFATVKGIKHMIIRVTAFFAVLIMASCSKASSDAAIQNQGTVMVLASGYVYEAQTSSETPQPIKGISLRLASMKLSLSDEPITFSTTQSTESGQFILYLEYDPECQYVLTALDTDGFSNGGMYLPETIKLNITGEPEIDDNTGQYTHFFWNSDFHLHKAVAN